MALPDGVSVCHLSLGKALSFLGTEASVSVSIRGDRVVIHTATGWAIYPASDVVASGIGGEVTFDVPHVDQDGFQDTSGAPVTFWSYAISATIKFPSGETQTITSSVQPIVGQDSVDIDLAPHGTPSPGVVGTIPAVASVAGLTGVVATDDLFDALEPDLTASFAAQLTTRAVTADATAAAQEFIEADSSSGVLTVTGPAVGAKRWGVKKTNGTAAAPGNKVTISYLNSAGATATIDLTLAAESKIFRPSGTGYRVESGDTPKAGLDATYAALAGANIFTGVQQFVGRAAFNQPGAIAQLIVKSNTLPDPTYPLKAVIEWMHDGDAGDIIHLTSGPTAAPEDTANMMAVGVDNNRVGLFIHNRDDFGGGVGLKITNRAGITNPLHHGLRLNQSSPAAPGAWFGIGSTTGTAEVAQFTCNVIPPSGQRLVTWRTTRVATNDTLLGYVDAYSGAFVWQGGASFQPETIAGIPLLTVGLVGQTANLFEARVSGVGAVASIGPTGAAVFAAGATATAFLASGAGASLALYDTAGTANARRFKLSQNSSTLLLTARSDADANTRTLLQIHHTTGAITPLDGGHFILGTTTGTKFGTATSQKIGFFNATPIVQPSSTLAAATDAATTQTLVNDLRTKLLALGLIA